MFAGVVMLGSTAVDLARIQFATTSLYHFLFVPLTLGLAPLVATMQTLWRRTGDDAWLRLTRFFGTLLLINFAIGVATGLVQEFQFGMHWSIYSKYVGNVFGAPLAIEGRAAHPPGDDLDRDTWHLALGVFHPGRQLVDAGAGRLQGRKREGGADERLVAAHGRLRRLGVRAHDARGSDRGLHARFRSLVLAPRPRPRRRALSSHGEARSDRSVARCGGKSLVRQSLRHLYDQAPADEDLRDRGAVGHGAASVVLALPDRRLHAERREALVLDRSAEAAFLPRGRLVQRQGRGDQRAAEAGSDAVRPGELHPTGRGRLLVDARHGLPRHARLPRRCGGLVPLLARAARADTLVPLDGGGFDRLPVPRRASRLAADGAWAAAVDRPRPAENLAGELAKRRHHMARPQPRGLHRPLPPPRHRRLRAHAPLCATGSARAGRRVACAGGDLLR